MCSLHADRLEISAFDLRGTGKEKSMAVEESALQATGNILIRKPTLRDGSRLVNMSFLSTSLQTATNGKHPSLPVVGCGCFCAAVGPQSLHQATRASQLTACRVRTVVARAKHVASWDTIARVRYPHGLLCYSTSKVEQWDVEQARVR